jgi:hypothetical protein
VVETSPHSLNARNGGSRKRSAREGPVYPFSREAMPSSRIAGGGLHMITWHLLTQLLLLQEPCVVKVVSDKEYLSEFG